MKKLTILLILFLAVAAFGQSGIKPMLGKQVDWSHPLSKGLIFFPPMNEGSGDKVYDLSGNGHTGEFQGGGITWTGGKYGSAIAIPAAGSYVNIASHPLLSFPCTINVWFYLNELASNQGESCIFCVSDSSISDFLLLRVDDDADELDFSVRVALGTTRIASTTTTVPAKTWCMATAVYRSLTDREVYLNAGGKGVSVDSTAFPVGVDFTGLGARHLGAVANHLDGRISHVMIYNRALTYSEISKLYQEPFCFMVEDLPISMMYDYSGVAPTGQVIMINMSAITLGMALTALSLIWLNRRAA